MSIWLRCVECGYGQADKPMRLSDQVCEGCGGKGTLAATCPHCGFLHCVEDPNYEPHPADLKIY